MFDRESRPIISQSVVESADSVVGSADSVVESANSTADFTGDPVKIGLWVWAFRVCVLHSSMCN